MSPSWTPEGPRLNVVMLPWLAHGHVSPFLELAKRLSRRNIVVHLCSTPINLCSIKEQLDGNVFPFIRLVELRLPSLPGLPSHLHTTKYLPPHLMPTLKEAFDHAEPSFEYLLQILNPDLLVYDFIQPWAPLAARRRSIPAVQFLTTGAASTAFFCHYFRKPTERFPFTAISFGSRQEDLQYMRMFERVANGISDGERVSRCLERSSSIVAVKSFREVESKYMDYLSLLLGKQIVPTGPLLDDALEDEDRYECRKLIEWLGRKARSSVVFVSFGSEYFMCREETEEIARGLELSEVAFIWVVRLPNDKEEERTDAGADSSWALSRGFLESKKGLVVEGWAPQRRILAHPSVGSFVTHCGWSSVMEGMSFGVPMVMLPLQLDQPLNAKLVTELGVGVEVKRELGAGVGSFKGEQVAKAIRNVLAEKDGEGVRRKAKEMAERMGGKGDEEIRVLVEKMFQLCNLAEGQGGFSV